MNVPIGITWSLLVVQGLTRRADVSRVPVQAVANALPLLSHVVWSLFGLPHFPLPMR